MARLRGSEPQGETGRPEAPALAPLASRGPFYASILAPGLLDTKGGPVTNINGQVLDGNRNPIPGLYAVGNCASSVTARSYWGAGATLAPMITFAWIAGRHAATAGESATMERAQRPDQTISI
jgi:succinate dehydrogenase/fumarate reductase flavoprotein subunit